MVRVEFSAREDATPTERMVDGFVFLSGGIFQLIDRIGMAAEAEGFGGKIRLDVVTKDLLDAALEPLTKQYGADELEGAAEILSAAIERIGREFYSEQYEELDDDIPWAETA